jgi:hypothetical protein
VFGCTVPFKSADDDVMLVAATVVDTGLCAKVVKLTVLQPFSVE